MPNIGDRAPDFTLPGNDGKTYSLNQFKDKKYVVLVFYPGDDISTCTKQLCDYRDGWGQFQQQDTFILGISTNDMKSHEKFATKYNFPFPLLEDSSLTTCKAYDAMMLMGLLRITKRAVYIIDKQGVIRYKYVETLPIFRRTKEEILSALKEVIAHQK